MKNQQTKTKKKSGATLLNEALSRFERKERNQTILFHLRRSMIKIYNERKKIDPNATVSGDDVIEIFDREYAGIVDARITGCVFAIRYGWTPVFFKHSQIAKRHMRPIRHWILKVQL